VAPWAFAATLWHAPRPRTPVAPPSSRWFRARDGEPPTPPTRRAPLPANPVVVLVTIDATRADAVNDPQNDALFPTLAEMKKRGVWFTDATAPGSQTAVSLSIAFSGRYFSELRWEMFGVGPSRFAYAADDPTPRFPQLLTAAGVKTATWVSIIFLSEPYGVARGFAEEKVVTSGRRHAAAKPIIDPLLERLRKVGPEPTFLYAHLTEPHEPYDRGRTDGTQWERYLSEIAVADAQIGRVQKMLESRFPGRGILVVSADHGEAFGEHGTKEHSKTIYEELLRVPLLIRGAGIAPRRVDEHVGLIDVGPTVLDLFGLPTPAVFQGQSLVPLLLGDRAPLERPVLAEGRLRRALYTPDGLKVIEDERRKVVEVYDLAKDPGELSNLWDVDRARSDRALAALQAFFAAHTRRDRGYRPTFKP
jgi:arylsulfatase A-like enzyme